MTDPTPTPHSEDFFELAALYAIDALEPDDREQTAADIAGVPELEAEVTAFIAAASLLSYDVPLVAMAADLKDRLFQRIDRNHSESLSPLFQLLNQSVAALKQQATTLDWEAFPGMDGVSLATLRIDEDHRQIAFFIRAEGAGQFPQHHHATGEAVLVLEGDFGVEEQRYYAGDRIDSPADTAHQPSTFNGCLLFCVSSIDDQFLT